MNSKASKQSLRDYVTEVEVALKRLGANETFQVETNASQECEAPHFSVANLDWEKKFPLTIKEKIAVGKKSGQAKQQEFDGWAHLSSADLMSAGILMPELTVNYDWEASEHNDDLDWVDVNLLHFDLEQKLIIAINYSQLSDGNYILSGTENRLLIVKDGKLIKSGEVPSRVPVF